VHELLADIRPDVVFHLAGQVTAAPDLRLILPTFHSLLTSTVNILSAAAAVRCQRLILTGSLTEPKPDRLDPVPSSPYAAAKWMAAAYGRMFHKLYGAPVVVLRPFMAYGPKQNREKVIPHMIQSLLRGDSPRLSSGQWEGDWIYVDDVIDGFLLAASREGIDGCTIDLGTGSLTSIREIAWKLVGLINPHAEPLFGAIVDRPDEQVRPADISLARGRLGWKPKTALDEGLAKTVQWHIDQRNKLKED
jgi:UDP-glucose 4-epimerase